MDAADTMRVLAEIADESAITEEKMMALSDEELLARMNKNIAMCDVAIDTLKANPYDEDEDEIAEAFTEEIEHCATFVKLADVAAERIARRDTLRTVAEFIEELNEDAVANAEHWTIEERIERADSLIAAYDFIISTTQSRLADVAPGESTSVTESYVAAMKEKRAELLHARDVLTELL